MRSSFVRFAHSHTELNTSSFKNASPCRGVFARCRGALRPPLNKQDADFYPKEKMPVNPQALPVRQSTAFMPVQRGPAATVFKSSTIRTTPPNARIAGIPVVAENSATASPKSANACANLIAQVTPIASNGGHWPLTQTMPSARPAASMTASAG